MKLIAIDSPEENRRILKVIKEEYSYWTSGTDEEKEGHFVWKSTGNSFEFNNWHKDQPNNFLNSNCVVFVSRKRVGFKFNDIHCGYKRFSICYRENETDDDYDCDCDY